MVKLSPRPSEVVLAPSFKLGRLGFLTHSLISLFTRNRHLKLAATQNNF